MMKRLVSLSLMLGLLCGSTLVLGADSAEAKAWKKRVNHRQRKQQKRIHGGLKDGSLTGKEYAKLQKKQAKLNRAEKRMRLSDGKLTRKEAYKIEKSQDKLSKNIYKQKHDRQDRH